ncbi:type I restriction-modification system subunit M [Ureaplasma diversum]|uniref:type I restriction-modification system subunit M n=1 Tax=Ureaplasma diversum TaxID=42094 RepID=UPI000ABA1FCD|nr:type I restriction-modification system subunit M [Ureaplasma diversum]
MNNSNNNATNSNTNSSTNSIGSAQRDELHKNIWAIADEVRGAVDGWDFKQYVLGILFYRFISENITTYFNKAEHAAGNLDFNYANISDEQAKELFEPGTVDEKGFFIKPSELFCNVAKEAEKNQNLNVDLDTIFKNIEKSAIGHPSESNIKGLFDDIDTTSNRLGHTVSQKNDRLAKILKGIANIKYENLEDNEIDTLGDAYEFLISNYASNAGKSGGEFFTPQSVSKLLAKLAVQNKETINKVYDPTCGSGSLLLQVSKQFNKQIEQGFFGQEINQTTYNLARMNMFLHNVNYDHFSIKCGDTLLDPLHNNDKPFDVIVSNPPYSIKWIGDNNPALTNDLRFAPPGVLAPKSYADYAFILHSYYYLSSRGTAAIVCFPGIFYRLNAELKIRQYLIKVNAIDCVIQLPPNLFFGTSIATCVLVLAKNKKDNNVLFIDASNEFVKETNNNILSEENILKIVDAYNKREDIAHFSRNVSENEIVENGYNLSVSTYVEKEDTNEKIDIEVLNQQIDEIIKKIDDLRVAINQITKQLQNH